MTHSPIQKLCQLCRQVTTLKIMIATMKTKFLVEIGASWMIRVELGAKKLPHVYISIKHDTHSPIRKTSQSCRQVRTLKIMIVIMKTKLLVEFGASWMM